MNLDISIDEDIIKSLIYSCSFSYSNHHYVDIDLFLEGSRLSFDSEDVSFLNINFWEKLCENRDVVSWNGFCKRLYNNYKTSIGKNEVMKCLVLLERWKEDDKLIRKYHFELFIQGIQIALYVFDKRGSKLNVKNIWTIKEEGNKSFIFNTDD
jgi:hypothetical protein